MQKKHLFIAALSVLVLPSCALQRAAVVPSPGKAAGPSAHKVVVEPGSPGMLPWQRPYSVDGIRYVPLLKADGFREDGLASWYGLEEHGKPTSNGETYDMYKMTAAHKTLPLGSNVRVTNKSNGRQVTVRVNDRGPFVAERVIDLSYQAAKELDMVDHGVIPVAIEVVSVTPVSPVTDIAPIAGQIYTLQVAALTDRDAARSLSERMQKEFDFSFIQPVQTEKGFFYRVYAGKFKSKADAEAAKASLAAKGFPDAFVTSRQ